MWKWKVEGPLQSYPLNLFCRINRTQRHPECKFPWHLSPRDHNIQCRCTINNNIPLLPFEKHPLKLVNSYPHSSDLHGSGIIELFSCELRSLWIIIMYIYILVQFLRSMCSARSNILIEQFHFIGLLTTRFNRWQFWLLTSISKHDDHQSLTSHFGFFRIRNIISWMKISLASFWITIYKNDSIIDKRERTSHNMAVFF